MRLLTLVSMLLSAALIAGAMWLGRAHLGDDAFNDGVAAGLMVWGASTLLDGLLRKRRHDPP